ncbi:hypothetical protein UA3_02600 [Enterococcus faecium EnGen0263]|uniref:hypothetical protein n=1 Tax=Enterococcus faecium TaxID=1352 RepID=UPI00032FB41B|nr:hypothetical protein [Enterococcus faecium]EOH52474.1 hypothetical protein UA3_02600 [Enterococcus faecium EnGen0263]
MVEKFYAYYKGKKINAYQALRKRNRSEIATSPVEKAELFDSLDERDRYPLKPVKARNSKGLPYFAYYSGYSPVGNSLEGGGEKETLAHSLFQDIFLQISQFTIEDGKDIITIFVDNVTVDLRRRVDEQNYYIVDVMYRLKKTNPYSYYYKWNGYLAFEIVVTTRVSKDKVDDLSLKGIQICSFKVPNTIIKELQEIENLERTSHINEETYQKQLKRYLFLYQSNKFKVWGRLLGSVVTKDKWKEKYQQMKLYEKQEQDMLAKISSCERNLQMLQRIEQEYNKKIDNLRNQSQELTTQLDKIKLDEENILSLSQINQKLLKENASLEKQQIQLNQQLQELSEDKKVWEKHPIQMMWKSLTRCK